MNELRTQIQTALSSLTSIECGVALPDDLVKEGTTYFSYELEESFMEKDFDKRNVMKVSLTGRLVRKEVKSENTLYILDTALEQIKSILKSLCFDYSYRDVSSFTDGCKKISVSGTCYYYEKNKELY